MSARLFFILGGIAALGVLVVARSAESADPQIPATPPQLWLTPVAQIEPAFAPVAARDAALRSLSALDAIAGYQSADPPSAAPAEYASGELPIGDASCDECRTKLQAPAGSRLSSLKSTFTLHAIAASSIRHLRLRARYRDGLIVYLNGNELLRSNVKSADQVASSLRGPEWESFVIALDDGELRNGSNELTLETVTAALRESTFLDASVEWVEAAGVAVGPIARDRADGVDIHFSSAFPSVGWVEVERNATVERITSTQGALAEHHVATIAARAGETIRYRAVSDDVPTPWYSFTAAPAASALSRPIRFAVYGDVRGGHDVHRTIVQSMLSAAPEFVVATGDLVLRGSDAGDWQRFFAVTQDLLARVSYYPAVGNHDLGLSGSERRDIGELLALPIARDAGWYSFDYGPLHFVVFDSNRMDRPSQREWLTRDLQAARARGATGIFAATHDGPFSRGYHGGNQMAAQLIVPILEQYGVHTLFSGHDHLYQRGKVRSLHYVVSGGGGAPLYTPHCRPRSRCRGDGMERLERAHHYIIVTVSGNSVELCAKRPDGTALEPCTRSVLPAYPK